MKLIVRYVAARGVGREIHDFIFEGERATIGRGTDQSIPIQDKRIPLSHSVLMVSGEKLLLKAESGYSFTVNDHVSRSAELNDGDIIDILGHQIKVLPGEDNAEHIVEVHIEETNVEPLRDRFTTRLWQLNFPERKLAWLFFLSIIAVGVIVPSAGFFVGMDVLRNSPLPDDSQWLAGELHHTHAFTGDDCNFCHTQPFTPVRDVDCLSCHLSVNHHFDTEKFGRDYKAGNRCGDCHKEHSGPDSITRIDQAVCTVCHEDLTGVGLESEVLRSATDFLEDHPAFRVTMKELADGVWRTSRFDAQKEGLMENSNLIFPHDLHLDSEGIDTADGTKVMECDDCHVSEKGGLRMKTVTMESHCASCHQLTFDPDTPDRVVPHGSPEELMQDLRGYYAYQFLNRNVDEPVVAVEVNLLSVRKKARRPGRRRERQLINEFVAQESATIALTTQARAYVERRVNEAAANLFERQTCTICHDITRDSSQEIPWIVRPVRLTTDWFPMAEFSHDSHKNMQCSGCHEAEPSALATDVLMPEIGSCRICHGGEDASDRLQSSCITCHKFHLDEGQPMGAHIAVEGMGNPMGRSGDITAK